MKSISMSHWIEIEKYVIPGLVVDTNSVDK